MADQNVNTVFTAQDKMSATVKKIRGELVGFQKSVGGVKGATPIFDKLANATGGLVTPTTLAIGGAVALGGALVHAAKAAAEEEVGIKRLDAALVANVKGWDGNTQAIDQAIRSRELLAFSDDKLRESLGLLLPATKNVDEALRLQAIAMDLARLRGTDLAETSVLISKVYQGNLASLKRFGINLKGVSSSTEALAKIQELAAGQAVAYGNTLSGKSESLDNKLANIEETIGTLVIPKLTEMTDVLLIAADSADALTTAVGPQLAGPLGDLGETITSSFRPDKVFQFADAVTDMAFEVGRSWKNIPVVTDRAADAIERLTEEGDEANKTFRRSPRLFEATAGALEKVTDEAENAADALGEMIFGPAQLRGELAELVGEADETERAIRKLSRKKDLTKEDRRELKILRGDLAETQENILTTATKLKTLGEPIPPGIMRSLDRLIGRQDVYNDRLQAAITRWRRLLGLIESGGEASGAINILSDTRRQHGGPVRPGRTYTVGEAGPERLVMGARGGFVIPTSGGRGGESGGGVAVPIVIELDGDVIYRSVERRQMRRLKTTPFV